MNHLLSHQTDNGMEKGDHRPDKNGCNKTGSPLFFFLLLAAIVMNLVPFHLYGIQDHLVGYPAIIQFANSGDSDIQTVLHRRGLYLALGMNAPGVNLLVPKGCPLDVAQLYGLGRARKVLYEDYDPERLFTDVDFSNYVVVEFNEDKVVEPGPFKIIKGKGQPETMIVLQRNNAWYIVDTSFLPTDRF